MLTAMATVENIMKNRMTSDNIGRSTEKRNVMKKATDRKQCRSVHPAVPLSALNRCRENSGEELQKVLQYTVESRHASDGQGPGPIIDAPGSQ